jgi:phosphoglycolate phosphatase
MRHAAVLFDLDGTLLDTLEDLANSMNRTLAAAGFPVHPTDSYRRFVGQGMKNLARATLPEGTDEATVESVRAAMEADYDRNWAVATKPYPGIMDMLAALRGMNLPLAVFSNKPDRFTRLVVERFFPQGMFAHAQGAKPDVPIKPSPDGALQIARVLGFSPEEVVYVGDTDTDMKTGKAAGMFTAGVTWGFRPEQLRDSGADAVIERAEDLLRLFK